MHEQVVAYEFKRGQRRTIGFVVGPEGLAVRAPRWVSLLEVDAAVQEKADWIVKKLGETRDRHEQAIPLRIDWRDGTLISFLGAQVQVCLDQRQAAGFVGAQLDARESPPKLYLDLAADAAPDRIREVVQTWMMRQARRFFAERLDHFAPLLQVKWRKLALSNAATRWGSASIDGSIRLNWRLLHLKMAVIDYVVVHELSHLRVMNHSPRFWDTVASVLPDYLALRRQLKDDTVRLPGV